VVRSDFPVHSKGVDIVAVISRRVRRPGRRWWASTLAMTFALGLVLSACGFSVQTNLPYTPSEGVNLSIGSVQIRNLMVLSKGQNEGFVSATMSSTEDESLVAVSGTIIKSDGSNGGALTATIPAPVSLTPGIPVVLTDSPAFVTVKGDGLTPGLTVNLTMEFRSAGRATLLVPVVDASHPYYVTVSPEPSSSS
jgi:hypothetical protein